MTAIYICCLFNWSMPSLAYCKKRRHQKTFS